MTSSLQLNLFVPQPDPLTKEQLFSEERRNELRDIFTDEEYNFYKEHTRFVSYQELLGKLAQMKDWLNKNITDWDTTAFFSHNRQGNSNKWITDHFYNNLPKNINYIENKYDIDCDKYTTFIITDDASYSGEQLHVTILHIKNHIEKNNIHNSINIILAIPYFSIYAFNKFYKGSKKENINIIIPDYVEIVPIIKNHKNHILGIKQSIITESEHIKDEDIHEYRSLLIFEHKKADYRSIPYLLDKITINIIEPYNWRKDLKVLNK